MAICEFWDFAVNTGDPPKLAALIREAGSKYRPPEGGPAPLNTYMYAPAPTRFVLMMEWNSLSEMERWGAAFNADATGQGFWHDWGKFKLMTRGAEYWSVYDVPQTWSAKPEGKAGIAEVLDWQVRPADREKIVNLMSESGGKFVLPRGTPSFVSLRAFTPSFTRYVQINEWRSFAELEQWYAAFGADPVGQGHFGKLQDLITTSSFWQFWEVL